MAEITQEARQLAIETAVAAAKTAAAEGKGEAREIQYKGGTVTLPVIQLSLDYVLLNPRSHRIGAQVQSLSVPQTALLESDPIGDEAQKLIAKMLSATDGFQRIKNVLQREKQRDEGVITRAGILINANTRAVALRELGEKYIKVVVLPSDAGDREFNDIELRLQMAVDAKQDYNLTSQLLFIEDLIKSGQSVEEVGRLLRPDLTDNAADSREAKNHVERELRLLDLVRDLVQLGDGRLKFTDLDDNRQALIEIDGDYQSMKNKNRVVADRVRDAQMTAMLANIDYRKIRGIDDSLLNSYVVAALEEEHVLAGRLDDLLAPVVADTGALDGLDLLDDDDEVPDGLSFRPLLSLVASADREGTVTLPAVGDVPEISLTTTALRTSLQNAFAVALTNKQQDTAAGDTLSAPTRLLEQATRAIDNARSAFDDVHAQGSFDRDAFDRAQEKLERAYDSLLDAVNATLPDAVTSEQ